ncbi:MAG TPA: hypothetical protein VFA22_03650, partial [Stellaceae bacterium]|nr:hypothetical protein [Stellaceae bacterium]
MAKHYRKMIVHGEHLEAPEGGPPWTVLWETKAPTDDRWSIARAESEQAAIERAVHFLKLGFVVHAIKDPSGTVVMDDGALAQRFGANPSRPRSRTREQAAPSAEQTARTLLRELVNEFQSTPGSVLNLAVLRALSSSSGIGAAEFESAVGYATEHGWLDLGSDA